MKILMICCLLGLAACNRNSSPDGRAQLRDEEIHKEIARIKSQQNVILDSLQSLNKQLQKLKQNPN